MNDIHETVIMKGDISLGENNIILPYTYLEGPLEIGDNNLLGPSVVIGRPAADANNPRYDATDCMVKIGNGNIIREFCAIQKPRFGGQTIINDDIHLMQNVSISHDVHLGNCVVVSSAAVIAGTTVVMEGANIGMGATVHQYSVVGAYSIIATNAAAVKNIKPFAKYIPGKPLGVNYYALKKYGMINYQEEINAYVLENADPKSPIIKQIVERYNGYKVIHGRKEY